MGAALHRNDGDFDDQPVSEINVTPLVDVMLVLLIVFMVAAPLMATGVPIDLPKTQTKPLNDQKPPLAVSIDAAGKLFVGTTEVATDQLLSTLLNQAENGLDRRIHVRADKELPYRAVLELMGQINSAGFSKVALVSETPKAQPPVIAGAPTAPVSAGAAPAAASNTPPVAIATAPSAPAAPASPSVAPPAATSPAAATAAPAVAAAPPSTPEPVPVASAPPALTPPPAPAGAAAATP